MDFIQIAQDEEVWIYELKCFLRGEIEMSREAVKKYAKIADLYIVDDGILF